MSQRRYPPLGYCMYCLASGVKLSEEHLIPDSLGGRLTLRDSVCERCQMLTGQPEQATLNREFQVPKTLLALKRRRARGKGPGQLPSVHLQRDDEAQESGGAALRPGNFPRTFTLPAFDPPGLLAGIDRQAASQPTHFITCRLQVGTVRDENVASTCALPDPAAFARSVAKWAYGYAVAERALGDCDSSGIRALLLGERNDVFNFVGSADASHAADRSALHNLRLQRRDGFLTVLLNLLGSAGMPPYEVVMGAIEKDQPEGRR